MNVSSLENLATGVLLSRYLGPEHKIIIRMDNFVAEMKTRYEKLGIRFDGDKFKERVIQIHERTALSMSEAFEQEKEKEQDAFRELLK